MADGWRGWGGLLLGSRTGTDDDEQPTWAGADRLADSFGDFLARLEPAPEDAPNAPGPSEGDAGWVDPECLDEIER
jgi:hypothetical protein